MRSSVPRHRRILAGLAAVVAASALVGCGLPKDRLPREISAADAPLDLSQIPGQEPATPAGDDQIRLYFVRDGLLQAVARSAPDEELETAITLLLAGPIETESSLGTVIPSETELNDVEIDGTVAILDLGCLADTEPDSCGLLAFGGQDQLTLFAQITCTATDITGISGVRFLQEGEPQDAPSDGGTIQSSGQVTCEDYASLLP